MSSSDYRIKYINSIIGDNNLITRTDTPDKYIYLGSKSNDYEEGFEGGIHINNARKIFLVFAAIIIILYVLDN